MSRRAPPRQRNSNPALGARVREQSGESWGTVKRWIATGKVFVDGVAVLDPGHRPDPDASIVIRAHAKAP